MENLTVQKILMAAAVRDLANKRLNTQAPAELDGDALTAWKQARWTDMLLDVFDEFSSIAELLQKRRPSGADPGSAPAAAAAEAP